VFDVSYYTTGYVAESEVVDLSESEGLEYPQEVFFFGFATFARGKISVQDVRSFCFSGSEF
jgi:hypothetical protein